MSKDHDASLIFAPNRIAHPKIISATQAKIASANAQGSRKGKFSALSAKYSSSLYENPRGSLALINPETIKSDPTNNLQKPMMYFITNQFGSVKLAKEVKYELGLTNLYEFNYS